MTLPEATAGAGATEQPSGLGASADDTGSGQGTTHGAPEGAGHGEATPDDTTSATVPPGSEAPSEEQLISDDEFQKLVAAGDPVAVRKSMQAAFTKKAQALAREREVAAGSIRLVQALSEDPLGTLQKLADRVGAKLVAPTREEKVKETTDQVYSELADVLGEDGAKRVMPALESLIARVTAPIRQNMQLQAAREAEVLSRAAIDGLTKKYPDWKKFEPKMMEIANKISPSKDVSEDEYLEMLYVQASHGQAVADKAKGAVDRINKSVNASETSARTVAPGKVASAPPGKISFKQAAAAAVRGERFED